MVTFIEQKCPLCTAHAEYCFVDAENMKYFKCPNCNYFQISVRAEKKLDELPDIYRLKYAAAAPIPPEDHLFVVRLPDASQREKSANEPFLAGYIHKSELSLNCR